MFAQSGVISHFDTAEDKRLCVSLIELTVPAYVATPRTTTSPGEIELSETVQGLLEQPDEAFWTIAAPPEA